MSQDLQESVELTKLHEGFSEAFRDNDFTKLGVFYTDTAIFLPPGRQIMTGRADILAFWQESQRILDLKFETKEATLIAADVLREVGTLTVLIRGAGRETRTKSMKYLLIWQKSDGQWQIATTAWSGVGGAKGRGRGGQRGGRRQGGGGGPQGGGRAGGGRRQGPGQAGGRRQGGGRPEE